MNFSEKAIEDMMRKHNIGRTDAMYLLSTHIMYNNLITARREREQSATDNVGGE